MGIAATAIDDPSRHLGRFPASAARKCPLRATADLAADQQVHRAAAQVARLLAKDAVTFPLGTLEGFGGLSGRPDRVNACE